MTGAADNAITVHRTDLMKVLDVLVRAVQYHVYRDGMNAQLHLAETVRYSPLTSEMIAARNRLEGLLHSGQETKSPEAHGVDPEYEAARADQGG